MDQPKLIVPGGPSVLDPGDSVEAARAAEGVVRWMADDPVALYRCAAEIGLTGQLPPPQVTQAFADSVARVDAVLPQRVREELERGIVGHEVQLMLQWLLDTGAMKRLLPELEATVGLSQESGRKHKDVWEHTKQVVRQSIATPEVRWSALLHDIGKVPTRTFLPDGRVHFHGHAEVGARMFDQVSRRLPFDKPTRQKVRFLILHHLRANQYSTTWTDSAVRRFAREMEAHLDDLLALSRADITSKRPGRRQELLGQIHELATRIQALRELDAKQPPLPTGLGNAISARFGIPPSRAIGDLKRALEAACERGELEERRDEAFYCDWLEAHGLIEKVRDGEPILPPPPAPFTCDE